MKGDRTMNYYVFGSRILMIGKKGKDVELLQHLLHKMPFLAADGTKTTGRFDEKLENMICRLQIYFQEEPDGVVGRDTYRLLGLEVDEYWPSSFPPLGMRSLKRGMQGRDVLILQNRLAASRKDYAQAMTKERAGYFDRGTQKALGAFQQDCGLRATGIFDDASCFALYRLTGIGSRLLQRGKKGHDRGYDVFCLQNRLRDKGYLHAPANGIFSLETEEAVKCLQQENHLPASGTIQNKTYFLLGK